MNDSRIAVVIPTYNEIKNIGLLIRSLMGINPSFSIVVIDDNSPDGTYREVKKLQEVYKNLYLIVRDRKRGLGSAYIEGFRYALRKGYELILQMDADSSHLPSYIPDMIKLMSEYDLVIGSRYIPKGGVADWPLGRVLISRLANIFSQLLLRIPIHDLTSGFKCMKRSVLEKIDFATLTSRGYVFQIEMVLRAFLKSFKIIEYPILFKGRKREKSKMSLSIILETFFRVIFFSFKRFFINQRDF